MTSSTNILLLAIQCSTFFLMVVVASEELKLESFTDDLRRAVSKTPGSVLPRPFSIKTSNKVIQIDPNAFNIVWSSPDPKCDIVNKAIERYKQKNLFFDDVSSSIPPEQAIQDFTNDNMLNSLQLITTSFSEPDVSGNFVCEEWPHEDMKESYSLSISSGGPNGSPSAYLISSTDWGFLRGLETFSQLIYRLDTPDLLFALNETNIGDKPRFKFRGFMLDTARHFIPVDVIQKNLDAMAYNKLNVFHWHIVDDQSFPYVSKKFPQLSEKAAFKQDMIYTQQDVANIIEYARLRGIRVIPEFDTPGHSYGMRSIPGLLTKCYGSNGKPNGDVGPMNPIQPKTYTFMNRLIEELSEVFPDKYFHAGGDEVDFSCWKSNPDINNWMKKNNSTNYSDVEGHYIQRLLNILSYHKRVPMVWQEVFDNGVPLRKGTIVHVWRYENDPLGFFAEMTKVTQAGHIALLSSCWYMNYISYGRDWVKFYNCDPQDFVGSQAQYDLVLGGEACMWAEYVDETNLISRSWPRTSTTAERLWSPRDVKDLKDFSARVEQLRCRLKARGISAEPMVGPGYC